MPRASQGVEGVNSSAHQRRRIDIAYTARNRNKGFDRSQHVLRIAAVITESGILLIATESKISAPALGTSAVVAAMPANADTLAFSPFSHTSPERIHNAGHFMTRNARIGDSVPEAFGDDRIAVAHTTCPNFDAHLSWAWIGNLQLDHFKTGSGSGYLGGFHGCNCVAVVMNAPVV